CGAEEVMAAAAEMLDAVRAKRPHATINGALVQQMAGHGKEMLLGLVRDPQFGPLVMVGFGGVYVEVFKDTAVRLAPLASSDARGCSTSSGWPRSSTACGESGRSTWLLSTRRSVASRNSELTCRIWSSWK